LDLPDGLVSIHELFHVPQLKKYNPDPKHIINDTSAIAFEFELYKETDEDI
jgi:hypothetical protein